MLLKSIFATLIAAGATGGAVYLAQNPDILKASAPASSAASVAADERETIKVGPAYETPLERADSKAQILDEVVADKEHMGQGALEESLQNDPNLTATSGEADDESASEASIASESVSGISEISISETIRKARLETDQTADLPSRDLPELPKEPVEYAPENSSGTGDGLANPLSDAPRFIDQILEQAAKISNVDLRDQAHLDVVDYAILRDEFDDAVLALAQISQPALRDTARNRMAIKYALNGEQTSAFELIDELENPELADFVRLQVVQALTVPDRLPVGVVPR